MQCPSCGLYHPARYEQCVSCGKRLVPEAQSDEDPPLALESLRAGRTARDTAPPPPRSLDEESESDDESSPPRRKRTGLPGSIGITIAALILFGSAGITFFFLTKPPESERLYKEGQKQLSLGQYAFAVKTLEKAYQFKRDDPRILLGLARAYVGIDQVNKAWGLITQAQQLGTGVVAEPQLASDLSNYYRQRNQYGRAVELIKPLAAANIAGKKAELADLEAMWGDESLRAGNLKEALLCWEDVKDLNEGSRKEEADSRLTTIYQRVASEATAKNNNDEALKYYAKLNAMSPSVASFEKTSELYEKQNKLALAIDQLQRAIKLSTGVTPQLNRRLSSLLNRHGKELLDKGDADAGYGYLQQAKSLDPSQKVPTCSIRSVHVGIDKLSGLPRLVGEVWNPSAQALSYVTIKGDIYDQVNSRVLWSKEVPVIDQFVPPLESHASKSFELTASSVGNAKDLVFRVYLDGALYKSYPLTAKSDDTADKDNSATTSATTIKAPGGDSSQTAPPPSPAPPAATETMPSPAPPISSPISPPGMSPEEKTLKDLD